MKYTNRILKGNVNIDGIVSKKPGLRQVTIIIGLFVSFFGLIILTGMLPMAAGLDSTRYAKLQYHYYAKRQRRKALVEDVLTSLAVPKEEMKRITKLITEV
jgi:hypothetical protein